MPHRLLALALVAALTACADDDGRVLIDLEGPRGTATAPGPWGVAVLTDGTRPRLWIGGEAGDLSEAPLAAIGGGQFTGVLPTAPVGAVLRYAVTAAGESLPPDGPRRVTVVAPPMPEADAGPPPTCRLAFRRPRDGDRLSEAADDGAPQAGLQVTVQVEAELPEGHPVRLRIGDDGHAGAVGQGLAAFAAVTLPLGEVTLVADAVPTGGEPCEATITVTVD
ncbi:MAG: hypothetical protein R3F65_02235 [bacterium]|nr:hypothetical protein [Myxococcales bacterium]MCB9543080.1 hypothetical protein [Myxococcales bacterium]